MSNPLLGEILIEKGEITREQLNDALDVQKREGGLIGIILVNLGFLSEERLVMNLALQAERVVKPD